MMSNSRDDITQIIANVGRQKEIETIRIYNKQGRIMYANRTSEVDRGAPSKTRRVISATNTIHPA